MNLENPSIGTSEISFQRFFIEFLFRQKNSEKVDIYVPRYAKRDIINYIKRKQ